MSLAPLDYAMPYFAAIDVLRAGGSAEDAYVACAEALRPGGVLDWLEAPAAERMAQSAIEAYAAEVGMSRSAA
jgi:hypothetical protein